MSYLQLNKLKSGIENSTKVVLNLLLNVTGDYNYFFRAIAIILQCFIK